jgi:hypothetical protein
VNKRTRKRPSYGAVRTATGIETRIIVNGPIPLDPPGIVIATVRNHGPG